jgi:hypothetical protein
MVPADPLFGLGIRDMDLDPAFSEDEIATAVSRVAAEISANHQD